MTTERRDWRKERIPRQRTKLVRRWFHWDTRPRWYVLYWCKQTSDMRHSTIRGYIQYRWKNRKGE